MESQANFLDCENRKVEDIVPLRYRSVDAECDSDSKSSGVSSCRKTSLPSDDGSYARKDNLKETTAATSSGTGGVAILGSGDFGRALALRLTQTGHLALIASRNPHRNRKLVEGFGGEIGSYEEVLPKSRIVVLAVPHGCHRHLPADLLRGKILVDVSNRNPEEKAQTKSIAERLQETLPESRVVKSLNTLSAYALERGAVQASKEVPVCGDDPEARAAVAQLVRDLTFQPVDCGGLAGASQLEDQPLRFFSEEWRFTFKLTAALFVFVWVFFFLRIQLCTGLTEGTWDLKRFRYLPLTNTQLTLAVVALIELALCYLPGVIAAYLQLWRGTKYSRFPDWLDLWLRSRKQIGLVMFLLASLHGCMAVLERMAYKQEYDWVHELYLALGALALGILVILAVTSLPSVSAGMSWREFTFVQSKLGWVALLVTIGHVFFLGWPAIFKNYYRCYVLPGGNQLSLIIPALAVVFKLPLLLPCLDTKLTLIRRGHEREPSTSPAVPV